MAEIEVVTFTMHDTGLGQEAGYRDDREMIAAAKAEREAMDPVARSIVEEVDRRIDDAFINGTR
jgi:hypothetical protein